VYNILYTLKFANKMNRKDQQNMIEILFLAYLKALHRKGRLEESIRDKIYERYESMQQDYYREFSEFYKLPKGL